MEPEGSLPCSQEYITVPYPESIESILHPDAFFKIRFNIILPSTPGSAE